MNTTRKPSVEATATARSWWRFLLLCLCVTSPQIACVDIQGGAAELTWALRTFQGDTISCTATDVTSIRLCWASSEASEMCVSGQVRDFDCAEQNGATLFEIEPGPTQMSIVPICEDGAPARPGTYDVPPPIVRTVREGEIVTLDSLLVVVTDRTDACGIECTCVR